METFSSVNVARRIFIDRIIGSEFVGGFSPAGEEVRRLGYILLRVWVARYEQRRPGVRYPLQRITLDRQAGYGRIIAVVFFFFSLKGTCWSASERDRSAR